MKKFSLISFLSLFLGIFLSNAQNNPTSQSERVVFSNPEELPEFSGGRKAFLKYLKTNLKYPKEARKLGVEGKVYIEFTVEKDGSLSNIKVLKGIGFGCDKEALRVMRNSPKWKPGSIKGEIQRVKMSVPIIFRLSNHNGYDKKPLIFLDGQEISPQEFEKLIPNNIEKIEIIKEQKAIEKYGARAKDGVIEIYTKTPTVDENSGDVLYLMAEQQPYFAQGEQAFQQYIQENLTVKYHTRGHVEGKLFVEFIVEKDGSLSHVKIIKDLEEVSTNIVEVLENAPQWVAGKQRGILVRVRMTIPVRIEYSKNYKEMSSVSSKPTLNPVSFYPNPVIDLAKIKVILDKETEVKVSVYNLKLNEIALLQDWKVLDKGTHFFEWKPKNAPSGIYLLQVQLGNEVITKKILVNK